MNEIARLEYELAFYDSAVQRFNHYATRSTPSRVLWFCLITYFVTAMSHCSWLSGKTSGLYIFGIINMYSPCVYMCVYIRIHTRTVMYVCSRTYICFQENWVDFCFPLFFRYFPNSLSLSLSLSLSFLSLSLTTYSLLYTYTYKHSYVFRGSELL